MRTAASIHYKASHFPNCLELPAIYTVDVVEMGERETMTELAKLTMLVLAGLILLSGCSSTSGPIIDTKGVSMARYEADLADCQGYSEQVHIERGVAKGAVAGSAVGAATGAVVGDVGQGAGVGAIAGAAKSAQRGEREKSQVVNNCLRGRGYRVLNN
jgi:outer membrane lipoprotein SlyB